MSDALIFVKNGYIQKHIFSVELTTLLNKEIWPEISITKLKLIR